MPTTFMEKLAAKARDGKRLCVGIDPVPKRIPEGVSVLQFIRRIVEATTPIAAAFKPNIGFFEGRGAQGLMEYAVTTAVIQSLDSKMPIIGDWKRGDIGATNAGYIQAAFDLFGVDAITVHPYLGQESLKGFLAREERGIIVLCRTSNPESDEFQGRVVDVSDDPVFGQDHVPLYQYVAHRVARYWNTIGNCGLVVGATYSDELAEVHKIAPEVFKLLPGVGTQGGDLAAAIRNAFNPAALPDCVINVSSAVLYAFEKGQFKTEPNQFAQAAARAAEDFDRQIRDVVTSLS